MVAIRLKHRFGGRHRVGLIELVVNHDAMLTVVLLCWMCDLGIRGLEPTHGSPQEARTEGGDGDRHPLFVGERLKVVGYNPMHLAKSRLPEILYETGRRNVSAVLLAGTGRRTMQSQGFHLQ